MKKVLIIEDDYSVMSGIVDLLEAKGYSAYTAPDGKEGLKLAKDILPDLIICDVMMPKLDGHQVLTELSGSNATSFIPFIFLTAKADMKDLREGMNLGADDYITKPYDAKVLLTSIEKRLEKSEEMKKYYSHHPTNMSVAATREKLTDNDRLFLEHNANAGFVKIGDIVFITAETVYSNIFTVQKTKILIRRTLKKWDEMLPDNFLRIHRSTIINLNHILNIEKWFKHSYRVQMMHTTETFVISQRYSAIIKSRLLQ
jgi:DNA-binding response OmpR family regulator